MLLPRVIPSDSPKKDLAGSLSQAGSQPHQALRTQAAAIPREESANKNQEHSDQIMNSHGAQRTRSTNISPYLNVEKEPASRPPCTLQVDTQESDMARILVVFCQLMLVVSGPSYCIVRVSAALLVRCPGHSKKL